MIFPIDKNDPEITVTIAGKDYTEDATAEDPSVFVKDKIVIPLDGDDATSDVTLSYQIVPEGQEYDEDGTWMDASNEDNPGIIYTYTFRDKFGNPTKYKNADQYVGRVLYIDNEIVDEKIIIDVTAEEVVI
jgi:hypothetical protein